MEKEFIHLHVHTEYSLLDGACRIKDLVKKVKNGGGTAVCMTDHGNMYGAIKLYQECKSNNLKPIIGCEFYVTEDLTKKEGRINENKPYHMVLIAKNFEGFLNLAKLNSIAYIDGFYYKPRIDLDTLEKYSENLICLSACIGGAIPRFIINNEYKKAKEYALRLKGMFAVGDFYIEIQDHGLDEEKIANKGLITLAKEIGVKVVATNDAHYVDKGDAESHDVLLCIQTASYVDETDRMKFPNDEFYIKSYDEMYKLFSYIPESLETPKEIVDKCNVEIVFNQYKLPSFTKTDGLSEPQYLRKISYEKLKTRYSVITDEMVERMEEELNVIIDMGFASYYLIVWDFIRYAKENDIPVGAGRGSGVGSLVAYAIGITNVDPLRYNLIFERFLNRSRTSMPDFDVDFCFDRRNEVIDYVKDLYGRDKISQIITFGKLKKKAAVKDVARTYRIPFADVNKITKILDGAEPKAGLIDLVTEGNSFFLPEFAELYNTDETYKKIIEIAAKVENMPRNTSVHAAGVVIYKDVASDVMPLARNGEEITTQFDMKEVEELGFLKMDFLALKTLTDVKMAHDYVLKRHQIDIDFEKIGYDVKEVFDFISNGQLDAVFQLESGGMKNFMARLKPNSLEEIIAGISLYRPGPMDSIPDFISNKLDPSKIKYAVDALKDILDVTFGVIVYQEQAMFITRTLAGYDMTRADKFRAIISKKKLDLMAAEEKVFIYGLQDEKGNIKVKGCVANGIDEKVAKGIFDTMKKFGSYAFNKSHAAAYAYLSYETAYYKKYYPVEFLCAVINNRLSSPDDTAKYMRTIKEMGFTILQPDINLSEGLFTPTDKGVRYGLACVKNVGKVIVEKIVNERNENGKFVTFEDFIKRNVTVLNRRLIESLIKGGAFDNLGHTRATLLTNYENILKIEESDRKMKDSAQFNLFDMFDDEPQMGYKYEIRPEFEIREKLSMEKEMLGAYVSGHPLEGYEEAFKEFNFNTSMIIKKSDDTEDEEEIIAEESWLTDGMDIYTGGILTEVTFKKTKTGNDLCVCILEDMYDKIECVIFNSGVSRYKELLKEEELIKIKGRLNIRDGETKIAINTVIPWKLEGKISEDLTQKSNHVLYINFNDVNYNYYNDVLDLLKNFKGNCEVKMQYKKQIYKMPINVDINDELLIRVKSIIGSQNVKVVTLNSAN